jgi:hypothetical protein
MTLNELFYKVLKPTLEANPLLRDVGFGDLEKYGNSKAMKFPFAWVTINNVRRRDNVFDFNLSLVFGDVVNHEETNIIDIQSDMIGVAADIAGKLVDDMSIETQENFTLDPFIQRFHDLTAGVVMDISITAGASLAGCEDC